VGKETAQTGSKCIATCRFGELLAMTLAPGGGGRDPPEN
jgi:hypothetical protein